MTANILSRTARRCQAVVGLFIIRCTLLVAAVAAQDISVTVSPVQQVLPPQVAMYIDNPGKYFNITLTNNTGVQQNVYLCINLRQTMPSSGLQIITPAKRLPLRPFTVPASSSYQLSLVEMRTMFNHLPKNEVQTTPGLFDNYLNGSFGLLPEGQYRAQLTAYRWDPTLPEPVAVSSPTAGYCDFTVCYKAQAPEFLTPVTNNALDLMAIAKVQEMNAQFTWRQPVVACNPAAARFTYNFKVVQVNPMQQPDDAIDHNPVVYQVKGLLSPMVIIPQNIIKSQFREQTTYAAQVEAVSSNTNSLLLDYVNIENKGKSPFKLFMIEPPVPEEKEVEQPQGEEKEPEVTPVAEEEEEDDNGKKQAKDEEDDDDTASLELSGKGTGDLDSLYILENPRLLSPSFVSGDTRKLYTIEDIAVEWTEPRFIGGEGKEREKLQYEYNVELFSANEYDPKEIVKTTPIYKLSTKQLIDTIRWEKIKDKVSKGDYMVLRVTPTCTNEKSVSWEGEKNSVDFAIIERLTRNLFQCSATTVIESTKPTKKKVSDLKKSVIGVGEYELTIDKIEKVSGKDCYKGTGHIEWRPLGIKTMVAVKFDTLYINEDDIAYGGLCYTYPTENDAKMSNSEVIDKLFSDWGIDNLIGDTQIPYSDKLQEQATSGIKNVAQKLDVAKYYEYVKKGQSIWDQFLKGEISDLHLPLQIPKSINKSPIDIQISKMKFAPTYATMDVIGEFTLPSSNYLKNDILLLGAPRLCISPERVLPEAGTLALLGNFTIVDPESSFEMTFKAPRDVLEPTDGCFVAWKADELEILKVDVDMKIPGLVKVDKGGTVTKDNPVMNFIAEIRDWDDWYADVRMDKFEAKDLPGWTFTAGEAIIFDHSKSTNGEGMGKLPDGYDRVKAGMSSASAPDEEWQGLYVKNLGVLMPKMVTIGSGTVKNAKNEGGRLKLEAKSMFFDASGVSMQFGLSKIFDLGTGKVGGWAISMDELMVDIQQNKYKKAYFNGKIKTPLDGLIGYRCDMYAQGKDAKGHDDPNCRAYVFKTQQIDKLDLDFLQAASLKFDKDQTYFLVEHETYPENSAKDETRVELSIGCTLGITLDKGVLKKKLGKAAGILDAYIPDLHIVGMRLGNCPRWKSKYTQNQYEDPGSDGNINQYFGWKSEYNCGADKEGGNFYFSIGRWSLASEKKYLASTTVGGMDFNLEDFTLDVNAKNKKLTFGIVGGVGFMNGKISASAGINLVSDIDIDNYKFKFTDCKFRELSVNSEFGGVTLNGTLKAGEGGDDGYGGSLTFELPGNLFKFDAKGGWYKHDDTDGKYTWGHFLIKVGGQAMRFDPIVLEEVKGGFFFNCAPTDPKNPEGAVKAKEGSYGGLFGVNLTTTAGDYMLSGGMTMTVVYDTKCDQLSTFILKGKLNGIKATKNSDGLINAEATISYIHNDKDQYFKLDISAQASADLKSLGGDLVSKLGSSVGYNLGEQYKKFMGEAYSGTDAIRQGLDDLTAEEQAENAASGNAAEKGDKKEVDAKDKAFSCSAGAKVTVNFEVIKKENGKKYPTAKWMLCIGKPKWEDRCTFTLIDFKVGKRSEAFAAWAYLSANAYLCLGNKLPDNKGLPDPPASVMKFLGLQSEGLDLDAEGSRKSRVASAKAAVEQNLQNCDGALLLGAGAEGDFGVNAGIVYAHGAFAIGFDLMLMHFDDNAKCQGGKRMGYKGYYGMGQVYAMLTGDLGVMIRLWFIKKDVSIINVGVGAILQGGMPNPAWAFGKVRARCSLLGGLFKFDHTIDFKAGDVCLPDYGNPLDDLEFFAAGEPGDTVMPNYTARAYSGAVRAGSGASYKTYYNTVSPYSVPRFTTNYQIDKDIYLIDENATQKEAFEKGINADEIRGYHQRQYKFTVEKVRFEYRNGNNWVFWKEVAPECPTGNHFDYTVPAGTFNANTDYRMILKGKAWEWKWSSGKYGNWVNPEIDGKRNEKIYTKTYYFTTGNKEPYIGAALGVAVPGGTQLDSKHTWAHYDDMADPHIALKDDISPTFGNKYKVQWELRVAGKRWTCDNYERRMGDEIWWEPVYTYKNVVKSNINSKGWDWYVWRIDNSASQNSASKSKQDKINDKKRQLTGKETASELKSKNSATYKYQPSSKASQPSATSMNNFFYNEEKEKTKNQTTTITKRQSQGQMDVHYEDVQLFHVHVDYVYDDSNRKSFANGSSLNYKTTYDEVYIAMDKDTPVEYYDDYKLPYGYSSSWKFPAKGKEWSGQKATDGNIVDEHLVEVNPYACMLAYTDYYTIGGKKVRAYDYSAYAEDPISGLTVNLAYPELRYNCTRVARLSIDQNTTTIASNWYYFAPIHTHTGSHFAGNSGSGDYSNQVYHVPNSYSGSIGESEFGKKVKAAWLSDIYTMWNCMWEMNKQSKSIASLLQELHDANYRAYKKDKDKKSHYREDVRYYNDKCWRNSVCRSEQKIYSTGKGNDFFYVYTGTTEMPYRQIFLQASLGEAVSGWNDDQVDKFNKNNWSYRYNSKKAAWTWIKGAYFSWSEYKKQIKKFNFSVWRVDTYHRNTGKLGVRYPASNVRKTTYIADPLKSY